MGFFEYLAFNNVYVVLMFIGFIGFVTTLSILATYLGNEDNFDNRMIKKSISLLIIFGLIFFTGLLIPGESYFREMSRRKNQSKVDEYYLNSKINDLQNDIDIIKDELNIGEE